MRLSPWLLVWVFASALACTGCSDPREQAPRAPAAEPPPPIDVSSDPPPVVRHPTSGSATGVSGASARIVPAANDDHAYATTDPVSVVRLVYRVDFRVPATLGEPPRTLPKPSTELYIDVSDHRLRARFVGPGWPVNAGAEIRLRRDFGGTYVFDANGGRPIGTGLLATWFQGGSVTRRQLPSISVRRAPMVEHDVPGDLVCALLAEWSGQPRDEVARRCGDGGAPIEFRVGPWRAERTAEVPAELPRSAMRADHADPPRTVPYVPSRAFMEPSVLARIPLARRRRRDEALPAVTGEEALAVLNGGPTRVVVLVGGVPVGWVDQGATGRFVGFTPGEHLVAAMRPLGNLAMRPHNVAIPAEITIVPPRRTLDEDAPTPTRAPPTGR